MSSRVGNIWLQLQGFVQDVVVHFCCVPAVEGWLWQGEREIPVNEADRWARGFLQGKDKEVSVICHEGCVAYQAIKHLIQDCSKAPPVHSAVVGLLMKNFRSKILFKRRKRAVLVKGIFLIRKKASPFLNESRLLNPTSS